MKKSFDALRVLLWQKGSPAYFGLKECNLEPEQALSLLYNLVYSDFRFVNVLTFIPEVINMRTLSKKVLTH